MNAIALNISNFPINQDSEGRYNLNDLHKASGSEDKNKPSNFLRAKQTIDLIELLNSEQLEAGIPAIITKQGLGTFSVKEIVYAYAMWISPAFMLKVIHAYDSLVSTQYGLKQLPEPKTKQALPGCLTLEMQDTIKALVKSRAEELPKEKQAGAIIKQWSAIKKKFGCTYKEVSPDNFVNIISLITRLPVEGELLKNDTVSQTNSVTINLAPLEPGKVRRWLVSQLVTEAVMMHPLAEDQEVMTREGFIRELQRDNYIVVKKDELLSKLQS